MIVTVNDLVKNYDDYIEVYSELDIFLKRLNSIEFTVTHRCSRACTYCYNTQHSMINKSNDIITKEIIDIGFHECIKLNNIIRNRFDKNKYKGINTIELFGGEPLLLAHYDINILEHIFKLAQENNFKITMPVNATYGKDLNKKIIELLKKYKNNILLSFSVDGTEIIQNFQRPINKKFFNDFNIEVPNENDTIDFIKECLENDLCCGFHPMLTPFSIKHPESLFSFIETFVNKNGLFALLAVRNCNLYNDKSITYEDADIFIDKYIEFYKRTKIKNWILDIPERLESGINLFNKRAFSCSILNSIYIDIDGKLDLCHRYKLNKNREIFTLGHINTDENEVYLDLNKICSWHRYDAKETNNCNNCMLSGMCGFSCMAEISEKYGATQYYDETVCKANKISMYLGLKIMNRIKEEGL